MVRSVSGGVAAALMFALAHEARAQAAPSSAASDQTTLSDVVIESVRPGVVRRIDRTSYDVRDDPQAKAAALIDILGKLPSVSVGADGKVRLLGGGGVTVQFDGKTTQGADIKLNTLTGADVERIEVITNPSSQFSAQGTGGIINIITRKRQKPGWSGTAGVVAGTDGVQLRLAPSVTLGKWTLGATLNANHQTTVSHRLEDRTYLDAAGAALGTRALAGRVDQTNDAGQGELKVTYRPTDKQSLTVSANVFRLNGDERGRRTVRSTYAGAPSYAESRDGTSRMQDYNYDASYEREGPREGETLKLSANYERWRWTRDADFLNQEGGVDSRFATRQAVLDGDTTLKLDYERPLGGKTMLTAGGSWIGSDHDVGQGLDNPSSLPSLGASYARQFTSRRETTSAYATLQFPAFGWTVLPGLRYEDMALDLAVTATAVRVREADLFPSLHVSRDVGGGANLKLSYSRRVQRPEADNLDPSIQYATSDSAWSGNPDLKPTFTDAYEIKLSRPGKRASLDLTVYDRESHGEQSSITRLTPQGTSIVMPVNAGDVTRRGGEASVRGPLGARLKYVVTANLYQRDGVLIENGVSRRQQALSYEGSLQLDYKSAAPTSAEAQQFQLSLRMGGPTQGLQSRTSGYYRADFTWRRPVTKKVSGVLSVMDIFQSQKFRNRAWGQGYVDVSEGWNAAPRVRLSLTYQIGGKS